MMLAFGNLSLRVKLGGTGACPSGGDAEIVFQAAGSVIAAACAPTPLNPMGRGS
jgi:hypothetical protein